MDPLEKGVFKVPDEVAHPRTKPRRSKQAGKENETGHSTKKRTAKSKKLSPKACEKQDGLLSDRKEKTTKKNCQKKSGDRDDFDEELRAALAELDLGDNKQSNIRTELKDLEKTLMGLDDSADKTKTRRKKKKKQGGDLNFDGELSGLMNDLGDEDRSTHRKRVETSGAELDCNLDDTLAGLLKDLEHDGAKKRHGSRRECKPVELLGMRSVGKGSVELDNDNPDETLSILVKSFGDGSSKKKHENNRQRQPVKMLDVSSSGNNCVKLENLDETLSFLLKDFDKGIVKNKHNSGRQGQQTDKFLNENGRKDSSRNRKQVKVESNLDETLADFTTYSKNSHSTGNSRSSSTNVDLDHTCVTGVEKVKSRRSVKPKLKVKPKIETIGTGIKPKIETIGTGIKPKIEIIGTGIKPKIETIGTGIKPNIETIGTGIKPKIETIETGIDVEKNVDLDESCRTAFGKGSGQSDTNGVKTKRMSLKKSTNSERADISVHELDFAGEDFSVRLKQVGNAVDFENCRERRESVPMSEYDASLNESLLEFMRNLSDGEGNSTAAGAISGTSKADIKNSIAGDNALNLSDELSELLETLSSVSECSKLSISNSSVFSRKGRKKKRKSAVKSKKGSSSSDQSLSSTCVSEKSLDDIAHMLEDLQEETNDIEESGNTCVEREVEKKDVIQRSSELVFPGGDAQSLLSQGRPEEDGILGAPSAVPDAKNIALHMALSSSLEPESVHLENKRVSVDNQLPSLPLFSSLDTEQSLPVCPNLNQNNATSAHVSKTSAENVDHSFDVDKGEKSVCEEKLESMPLFSSLDSEQSLGVATVISNIDEKSSETGLMASLDKYSQLIPNMGVPCKREIPDDEHKSLSLFSSLDSEQSQAVVDMSALKLDSLNSIPDSSCEVFPKTKHSTVKKMPRIQSLSRCSGFNFALFDSPDLSENLKTDFIGIVQPVLADDSISYVQSVDSSCDAHDGDMSVVEDNEMITNVAETDDENAAMTSVAESEEQNASCDGVCPESDISLASEYVASPDAINLAARSLTSSCLAGREANLSRCSVASSNFNKSTGSLNSLESSIGSYREQLNSPQEKDLANTMANFNILSFLSNGSPAVESGSYTELLNSSKERMSPKPVKKGLSTSTPVGENKNDTGSPMVTRDSLKPTGSPMVFRNTPKKVGSCLITSKDSPKPTRSPMVTSRDSPKPTVSPINLATDSPKNTRFPMVLLDSSRKTGSPMVLRDSPRKTRSPMVLRDSPRKTGSPMVLMNSPRKIGSPMVTARDSPKPAGLPVQLRCSAKKTESEKVLPVPRMECSADSEEVQMSTDEDGCVETLEGSFADKNFQASFPSLEEGFEVEEVKDRSNQVYSKETSEDIDEGSAGESPSLDSSYKLNEYDESRVGDNPSLDESSKLNEITSDQDKSHNSIVYVAEKSLQVSFASQGDSERSDVCSSKVNECSMVDVCDEICQVSMSSCTGSQEGAASCKIDEVAASKLDMSGCLDLENSLSVSSLSVRSEQAEVDITDKSLQVSFSSRDSDKSASRDSDESASRDSDKSASRDSDESASRDSDEYASRDSDESASRDSDESASRDSHESASRDSDESASRDSDESASRDSGKSASWDSEQSASQDSDKSASEDSDQTEASANKSADDMESSESNKSCDADSPVTQIVKRPGKTTPFDHQSTGTFDTTVYEDALTSQQTGRKTTQSWRSQPAPSSDEDNPDLNTRRRISRKSKKQATAAMAKVFDASSSDDLDDFLNRLKTPAKKQSESESDDDLSDFIVSNGEVSFETADESPEDDEVFYIKTGRVIEEAESVKKPPKKTPGATLTGKKSIKPLNTSLRKKALYNDGLSPLDDFRRTRPVPTMNQNLFCEEPSDEDVKSRKKKAASTFVDMNSDSDDNLEEFQNPCPPPKDKPSRTSKASKPKYINLSSEDEDFKTPALPPPKDKPSRTSKASKPKYINLSSEDEDFKTPALPPPKSKPSRKTKTKTPKAQYIDLSRDSDDDMEDFETPGYLPPLKSDSAPNLPETGSKTPAFRMPTEIKIKGAKTISAIQYGVTNKEKTTATFLRSLSLDVQSDRRHPEAHKFVTNFKSTREVLTKKLFDLYSSTVFENKLPEFPIKWNSRLTKTAGYCAFSREKKTMILKCRIELSVKVCDSAERLRDTLIHEMCHAAVWLLNGMKDGHGPIWKSWAQRANQVHRELPIIKRCHSYSIETKYLYKCSKCGYQIGRHSKSLDTDGKVCGYCRGRFELYVNGKNGLKKAVESTTKTPNKFAMFVKENYGSIKSSNQKSQHKDIMKLLSSEFAKTKISFS